MFKSSSNSDNLLYLTEQKLKSIREKTLTAFKEKGIPITRDQWVVLQRVSENDGCTQKEIAESASKDPAAITRIIDLLETKNFLKRIASPVDRRSIEIQLTVDGGRLVNKIKPIIHEIKNQVLSGLSKEEIGLFLKVLEKINTNTRNI